jgi:putative FmdB family regulatory protein
MPLYDFSCTKCGAIFEKHVPFQANKTNVTCPKGHRVVRRIFSPPQVVFKGSGWYSTDQGGSGNSAAAITT